MSKVKNKFYFLLCLLYPFLSIQSQDTNIQSQDVSSKIVTDAINLVRSNYIDSKNLTNEQLLHAALKGIVKELGPNAQFHSPIENQSFKKKYNGTFVGFGLVLKKQKSQLFIKEIIKDSPGGRSGLLVGDIVTEFDSVCLRKKSLTEINDVIRGDINTASIFLVERDGKLITYKVTRDLLKLKTISESKVLKETSIGYIKILNFTLNTPGEFKSALIGLYDKGIKGLTIDLRSNGGGSLSAALKMCSYFVHKGDLILYTQGNLPKDENRFFSRGGVKFMDMPVIILIDSKTASAAEIFSSCLRDYDKAVIVGQKSYGKGTVQSIFTLSNGSAISFTIAKYYTRSGIKIEANGIEPDIKIKKLENRAEDVALMTAISTFKKILKVECKKNIDM